MVFTGAEKTQCHRIHLKTRLLGPSMQCVLWFDILIMSRISEENTGISLCCLYHLSSSALKASTCLSSFHFHHLLGGMALILLTGTLSFT